MAKIAHPIFDEKPKPFHVLGNLYDFSNPQSVIDLGELMRSKMGVRDRRTAEQEYAEGWLEFQHWITRTVRDRAPE